MSKKLGPVNPEPPPVDPLKRTQEGLGVVVSREVSVQPPSSGTPLGTIKNEAVIVNVSVAAPEPIGQVRQVFAAPPAPPPPPPPVGVVQNKGPVVSAVPVNAGASPLGVVLNVVKEVAVAPPPPPVGSVLKDPPIYPPPPPPHQGNVGAVTERLVEVVPAASSNEPQKVVSIVPKAKAIIEQPIEISPFKPED